MKVFLRAAVKKFSEVSWKLLSHFPEEGIRRKFLFEETYKTLLFFGLREKNLSAGLSNSIQIFKKNSLRENFGSKKDKQSRKFFGFRLKKFWQVCQNCILSFKRNILGEVFCLENLQIHNFVRFLGEKVLAGWSKLSSTISVQLLKILPLFEKSYSFTFFFRASAEKFTAGLSKLHSFFHRNTLREKCCWKKFLCSLLFCRLRLKNFCRDCQNCSP